MSATATAPEATAAEVWVHRFAEGWRAPAGPTGHAVHFGPMVDERVRLIQVEEWAVRGDVALIAIRLEGTLGGRAVSFRAVDRITLRDGLAIERESYLDPLPLLTAVMKRPRAWPRFVCMRALQLRHRLATRRTR